MEQTTSKIMAKIAITALEDNTAEDNRVIDISQIAI